MVDEKNKIKEISRHLPYRPRWPVPPCPMGNAFRKLALALVAAAAVSCAPAAIAGEQASDNVSTGQAKAILMRMAECMARARSFSMDVRDSYDVYEETGQKIEFSETRTIILARPDRLRVERLESNGDKSILMFDGKTITLASPGKQAYAQTAKPGSVDNAIAYFVRDLGMNLPFSTLMQTTAPQELERRTQTHRLCREDIDFRSAGASFGRPHRRHRLPGMDRRRRQAAAAAAGADLS